MKVPSTNLPALVQALLLQRYTGQTVIHWKDGMPLRVEILEKREVALTRDGEGPTLQGAHSR